MDFFHRIFSTDFIPQGHSYFWRKDILWLMVVSNGIIALALVSIPVFIYLYVIKKKVLALTFLHCLLALFIVSCALTHILDIITIWTPVYRLDMLIRFVTAAAFITTAAYLYKKLPLAMAFPANTELIREHNLLLQKNEELQHTIDQLREEELKQQEIRKDLQEIQHESGLGSWKLDLATNDVFFSEEMFTIVEQPVSKDRKFDFAVYKSFVNPDDLAKFNEKIRTALESGKGYFNQYILNLPSGKLKYVFSKGKVLMNKDNKPFAIKGTVLDVTDVVTMQMDLKSKIQELNKSNMELEEFAYVASHDLKEPLRMIISYTQLLMRTLKDPAPTAKEYSEYIVEGGKRMYELIQDLLEYSAVKKHLVKFEKLDCNEILRHVLSNLEPMVKESKADIRISELPAIKGDREQITRLFENLLENALRFRKDNVSPSIAVTSQTQEQRILFSIADNGIGIDNQFKDRVFFLFQRLGDRKKYPGTGIGLSMCKKIVELHGGKIWFESEKNEGATFYFSLPK